MNNPWRALLLVVLGIVVGASMGLTAHYIAAIYREFKRRISN